MLLMSTTGQLQSSIAPLSQSESGKNKEVISPNPSMTTTVSSSAGHNRSKSNPVPSKPTTTNTTTTTTTTSHEHLSSGIPLVRSRTAPQGQNFASKAEVPPLRERSNSGSVTDANPNHRIYYSSPNAIDVVWQQSLNGPPKQQQQQQSAPDPSDPDSEEQALFEQRLCEDIYGVAVRKINHNGKSNLRYVKCLYVDASEVLHTDEPTSNAPQHQYSSNKSVSSRHSSRSLKGLSRFLGGSGVGHHRTSGSGYSSVDGDMQQRVLLHDAETTTENIQTSGGDNNNNNNNNNAPFKYTGKVRVLSWGKKKDVTVPLDKFTAVRKGKVNYRTNRNPCDSSRIVSIITSDIHNDNKNNSVSLDIEAPTRLDRDKFAKAFARFLNIPLIEEGEIIRQAHIKSTAFPQQQHSNNTPASPLPAGGDGTRSVARSTTSNMTPQSWKDHHRHSMASSVGNDASVPEVALTASASQTTNEQAGGHRSSSWKQLNAPLPVVTTNGAPLKSSAGKIGAIAKPPLIHRRSTSNGGTSAPPFYPVTTSNITTHSNSKIHNNNITNSNIHTTNSGSSRNGSEVGDPPLVSLPSSTHSHGASKNSTSAMHSSTNNHLNDTVTASTTNKKAKMVLEIPVTTKSKLSKNSNSNHATNSTPATSAISAHMQTQSTIPNTPATNHTADNINYNDISRDTTNTDEMDASIVSSITGVGFDQDLVEELHLALERMKVELEESRAEAARAVKVAEQAIQSAENSSSKDWNNTVTHKAAEAAATAQKKSAEAMAKARIAEERLQLERKNALLRTKQVEKAEQQASHWQTRAAAAEVQRHAVAEALESERKKYQELLRRTQTTTADNLAKDVFDPFGATGKPVLSAPKALAESSEVDRLRSKLAMENARRRKLLDELQDLRGAIRVYCRLKAPTTAVEAQREPPIIDVVSNEVLMVHRNLSATYQQQQQAATSGKNGAPTKSAPSTPLCFEFDGILASDMDQQNVYAEFEAICTSVVEGYKICLMSYGQAHAGKTYTMLGDIDINKTDHSVSIRNEGIHLHAMRQLFSLLEQRKDRFLETVTLNLVEVHDEKLIDLLAGAEIAESHGRLEARKSSSRRSEKADDPKTPSRELPSKLEIKTNRDGETVVRGVLSVNLSSYDDVLRAWTESLSRRSSRLAHLEDPRAYERDSHIVATLRVTSKNLTTGSTASGRMQFVDFAASDTTPKRPLGSSGGVSSFLSKKLMAAGSFPGQLLDDWKFTNKSLNTVREVVLARGQYQRSVPYRNSTITHLLGDSLEGDTKVVFLACISSDERDVANTACTLKLADEMRKVVVGKATRHTAIDPLHNVRK